MFLYEITFWSRTANSEKHIINENSGLITIGVSNNLWEVSTQGFDGIDAKQINCPNELCNTTRMLDCNSEKKRTWLKTYMKKWSRTLWRLMLLIKDALMSYLIAQGRFDVLHYCSRTLWNLILLFSDALKFHLIVLGRFEVLSCWSRPLWRLILLLKDAMKSNLIGQGHFEVLSYWSRSLWRQERFEVLSCWSKTLWRLILLFSDALRSYLIGQGRFEVLSYWSRTLWSLILLMKDALKPSCSTMLQLCFNRHALFPSSQLHENGRILKQCGRGRILWGENLHWF